MTEGDKNAAYHIQGRKAQAPGHRDGGTERKKPTSPQYQRPDCRTL